MVNSQRFARSIGTVLLLGTAVALPSTTAASWYGDWSDFVRLYEDVADHVAPFGVDLPPFAEISYPTRGMMLTDSGGLQVSARAIDDTGVQRLEFWANDVLIATDQTAPYSFNWNLSAADNGLQLLKTVTVDEKGNSSVFRSAVYVEVDDDPVVGPTEALRYLPGVGNVASSTVSNGVLMLASSPFGLVTATPTSGTPILRGVSDRPFDAEHIAAASGVAALLSREDGPVLWVLDVSDPDAPVVASQTPLDPALYLEDIALDASGTTAYLAAGSAGVLSVDLADPSQPVVREGIDTSGYAFDLDFEGGTLYVADGRGGLISIAVAGSAMSVVGTVGSSGSLSAVSVRDAFAYGLNQGRLEVLDVAQPSAMRLVATTSLNGFGMKLDLEGDALSALVTTGSEEVLRVFDVSSPASPHLGLTQPLGGPGTADDVISFGGRGYVATGETGIRVVSLVQVSQGTQLSSEFKGIRTAGAGDLALVLGEDLESARLELKVVSTQARPEVLGTLALGELPSNAGSMVVSPDASFAVIALGASGVWKIDLSNPQAPYVAAKRSTSSFSWAVQPGPSAHQFYVADGVAGLKLLDFANASNEWTKPLGGVSRGLATLGQNVAVIDQQGRLRVVDTAGANPTLIASVPLAGFGLELEAEGDLLVARKTFGDRESLSIFDASDPRQLEEIQVVDLGGAGSSKGFALSEGRAIVAAADAGISVYDLSNPLDPVLSESGIVPGSALDIGVSGPLILVADSPTILDLVMLP